MIGFYDYTVVLTYASLMFSMFGITQAIDGRYRTAIICLALSGLCDMFDGKVARTKKDRSDDQKLFGVQIDSLCDMVCFGVFPSIICYVLGVRGVLGEIAIVYYCICAVIRLGYFNVLETNRQKEEEGATKYYHGLPTTSITIILPLVFQLNFILSQWEFRWILFATLLTIGTLFIFDFKVQKPTNKMLFLFVVVVAIAVSMILLFSKYHIIRIPIHENALIDKLLE